MIVAQVAVEQSSLVVEQHLFAHAIAKRHCQAAVNLSLDACRVDRLSAVNPEHEFVDAHLARLRVHLDLGELRGERRRVHQRHVRVGGLNLMLVAHVQRFERDLAQRYAFAIRRGHATIAKPQCRGVGFQHSTRDLFNHRRDFFRRLFHRATRNERRGRRVRAFVERREIGVRRVNDDVVHAAAQHFGSDLREHRVRARAQIGRAEHQVERAVVVHLEIRAAHINPRNAAAVNQRRHPDAASHVRFARHRVPIRIAPPLPADPLRAACDTLRESRRAQRIRKTLAPFAQCFREREDIADLHPVAAAKFNRVESKFGGDFVHMHFEREQTLRRAVPAHRTRRRTIRVHHVHLETQIRTAIERERLGTRVALHGQRVRTVRAGRRQEFQRHRRNRPVAAHAGLESQDLRMATARGGEFFVARVLQAHGLACDQRQVRANIFDDDFLFASKAAAEARLDDADAFVGQAEHGRENAAHVKRNLGRGANHESVVLVPVRDTNVRLERDVLNLRHAILALEHAIRFRVARLQIAGFRLKMRGDVALRDEHAFKARTVGFVVNDRRVGFERVFHLDDRRQNFVLDFDERKRAFRDLFRVRRHRRDAVADETYFGIEDERIERRGERMRLSCGRKAHGFDIRVGQYGAHARQRARARRVNAFDARVRVWTGQDFRVQHPWECEIVGEGGLAEREFDRVHARHALADDAHRVGRKPFGMLAHFQHLVGVIVRLRHRAPPLDQGHLGDSRRA